MIPDTIKVRMQLSRRARAPGAKKRGFLTTGAEIVKRETPLGLYKGLGAVITGIVPKMAIRFTSFEAYKKLLANKETGAVSGQATFLGEFAPFPNPTESPSLAGIWLKLLRWKPLSNQLESTDLRKFADDSSPGSWSRCRCH